jgi:hypothetical protein
MALRRNPVPRPALRKFVDEYFAAPGRAETSLHRAAAGLLLVAQRRFWEAAHWILALGEAQFVEAMESRPSTLFTAVLTPARGQGTRRLPAPQQ